MLRWLLLSLVCACSSPAPHRAPQPDAGRPRTKLPADGGLFVDRDQREEELGRAILQDMDRLVPAPRLLPEQVTIGPAYPFAFEFAPGEVPEGERAIAVPVTLHATASEVSPSRIALGMPRGERLAAEPIVEWLDETGSHIVEAPGEASPTSDRRLLLVYFAPRTFTAGLLLHDDTRLGEVRLGAQGPTRPRSRCQLEGAFVYAPIPRKVLVEVRVQDAFATWTPRATAVSTEEGQPPTACAGFRRLDARGKLLPLGSAPEGTESGFVSEARFLAVYDLPEGSAPGELRWEGTDCEATPFPERVPLPRRLGPERGPPALED